MLARPDRPQCSMQQQRRSVQQGTEESSTQDQRTQHACQVNFSAAGERHGEGGLGAGGRREAPFNAEGLRGPGV